MKTARKKFKILQTAAKTKWMQGRKKLILYRQTEDVVETKIFARRRKMYIQEEEQTRT